MRAICCFVMSVVIVLPCSGMDDNAQRPPEAQSGAAAAVAGDKTRQLSATDLFDGIVINQTITRAGQDFYHSFSAKWQDQPLSERYTISVREQPSARFGSQVFIMFGNRRIFQGQISPNRAHAKLLSENAVDIAYKTVTEGEMQRLLFKDPDIGLDEI